MMQFFGQLMKLPLTALVFSMEMLVKTMQGIQKMADQSIDALVNEITSPPGKVRDGSPALSPETTDTMTKTVSPESSNETTAKEEREMYEQDLSGDDLKYVSYQILFTKRDLEVTLDEKKNDVVNYSTNGGSYGGLKIAEFFERVKSKERGRTATRPVERAEVPARSKE